MCTISPKKYLDVHCTEGSMGQIERFFDIRNEKIMIDTNLKKVKKKSI